jgi:uncharacterized phage protein (TIGR01671 family)
MWDIENKHMHNDVQNGLMAEKDGKMVLGCSFGTLCTDSGNHMMQFTGLKDKNGAEIYEGDILNVKFGDGVNSSRHEHKNVVVYWNADLRYCVKGGNILSYSFPTSLMGYHKPEYEVIGNIHENPDLLTK